MYRLNSLLNMSLVWCVWFYSLWILFSLAYTRVLTSYTVHIGILLKTFGMLLHCRI